MTAPQPMANVRPVTPSVQALVLAQWRAMQGKRA